MQTRLYATAILGIVGLIQGCQADAQSVSPDQQAKHEAAIRSAIGSYVEAFNQGDAAAVAAHWSDDGEWISPSGQRFQGREAIQAEMTSYFAGDAQPSIEVSDPSIRFLSSTVAVEEGTARVTRAGEEPSETSYLAIHVKKGDGWKMDSVRETVIPAQASNHGKLQQLDWMIGTWVSQGENEEVETTCQWTKHRNFLLRTFKVKIQDRIELEGTQVVGWDAANETFHSWIFDTDGGFGEGLWTAKDGRWYVRMTQTLSDGAKASQINIITPIDNDSFDWQSIGREVDGELLPDIENVTIVRKTPEDATTD